MKIGIVGNGGIVQMAMGCMKELGIEITALWCRNAEKGRPLCEGTDCKLYTDYSAFLKDRSFDTVYIGLINSLHYEYALKAIRAGKNCIVEKPFTTTYEEAEQLVTLAKEKKVYLFEAIMSRYGNTYEVIRERLKDLGEVRLVRSTYCQRSRRFDAYLAGKILPAFDPDLSGGCLYDINVYNVHFVEGLFGKPAGVRYDANIGYNGIDTSGVVLLDYGTFKAVCTGAKDCGSPNGIYVQGDKGYIMVDNRPGNIRNVSLVYNDGTSEKLDVPEEDNPMKQEFRKIREVMDAGDYEKTCHWMDQTLEVMQILVSARKDAGIVFKLDSHA